MTILGDGATDNAAEINAALAGPRRLVQLPPGVVRVCSPLVMNHGYVALRGSGEGVTELRFDHEGTGIQFGGPGAYAFSACIEDLTMNQPSGDGYAVHHYCGRGLTIRRTNYSTVRNFLKLGVPAVQIAGIENNGSGICRVTAPNHGFTDWCYVRINGAQGCTEANGAFRALNCTADTFDLKDRAFVNAYTGGGRAAPHALLTRISDTQEIATRGDYGIDAYSHAGQLEIIDTIISGMKATGETKGLYLRRGTTVYDRFDYVGMCGEAGIIGYDKNVHQDNTRLVNLKWIGAAFDGHRTAGIHFQNDNPDATGGGIEKFQFQGVRSAGAGTAILLDAYAAPIANGSIDGFMTDTNGMPIDVNGGSTGTMASMVNNVDINNVDATMRSNSGVYDVVNVSGDIDGLRISGVRGIATNALKARAGVRIESMVAAGKVAVRDVATRNFSGPVIDDQSAAQFCEPHP